MDIDQLYTFLMNEIAIKEKILLENHSEELQNELLHWDAIANILCDIIDENLIWNDSEDEPDEDE